jgi:hypothetical protein
MATITSISYLFRSSGGVIGISAASAIFQGTLKEILEQRITGPDKAEIIEIARKSITEVRSLLPPEPLAIVLETYGIAVRNAFYLSVVVTVLCLISTLYIQQFQLHSKVK